jgi:hypothetical protein
MRNESVIIHFLLVPFVPLWLKLYPSLKSGSHN